MDRLAYLPTAPQHFSGRLSSSPLSPGSTSSPPWARALATAGVAGCLRPAPEDKSRPFLGPGAESQASRLPGGPTHLTKPTATSSSERDREREKSILTSTTTVEHAPIWRPGRAPEAPPRPGGPRGPPESRSLDSTACPRPRQARSRAAAAAAAGAGAAAVAAPPRTPTPTSTHPSRPGPRTPSSRGPACCTTRA